MPETLYCHLVLKGKPKIKETTSITIHRLDLFEADIRILPFHINPINLKGMLDWQSVDLGLIPGCSRPILFCDTLFLSLLCFLNTSYYLLVLVLDM